MLYARVGDKLYIHGSRASRAMRLLAAGPQACLTVTLMQGLVLARSAFEHSANYESVVGFGRFEESTTPPSVSTLSPPSPTSSCRGASARYGLRTRRR
jgi:nitroimidazol reductase NimA-like FMN-containing flavoprotein (pyridoxamine 5'-phosphate oxidase superfamily)